MTKEELNDLSAAQVRALAILMMSVAWVDGVRPAEITLISQFLAEGSAAEPVPSWDESPCQGSIDEACRVLDAAPGLPEQAVLMCFMTGYCDGHLSAAEEAHVLHIGGQLGLTGETLAQLRLRVKDELVGKLVHLPDSEGVAQIAKAL